MASTVLVVDDDPVIVKLLQVNFEMEGYHVLTAGDGEEGLAKARAERPDVVLLDVMMPKMDGLQVATALRVDPDTRAIPILLLSAKAQAADVQAGKDVADDYITKPFDPPELPERGSQLLAELSGPVPRHAPPDNAPGFLGGSLAIGGGGPPPPPPA